MELRRLRRPAGRVFLATAVTTALALATLGATPAAGTGAEVLAAAGAPPESRLAPAAGLTPSGAGDYAATVVPIAVAALARDLGISREEARRRIESQGRLDALATRLADELGPRAGESRIDPATGELVVTVHDRAAAARAVALGARAHVLPRRAGRMEATLARLERTAPVGTTWAVDPGSGSVAVSVPEDARGARVAAFLAQLSTYGDAVRVERSVGAPVTQAFFGGQAVYGEQVRCTAGFNVRRGGTYYVLTAGHCTGASSVWDDGVQVVGPSALARFPGSDYGAIRVANPAALGPQPAVRFGGLVQPITAHGRVPVGASVCKTGATTGTSCGTVLRYNVTVRFAEGIVRGLTETTVCADLGDSGGPLYAGSSAQGTVSGGTLGTCGPRTRTYFQPVDAVLSRLGLTLL